mgnify:FL=1
MSIISSQLLFIVSFAGLAIGAGLSTGWYLLMVYP